MDRPLVSIVVAIYKSERFLDKLITSIIEQTYSNLDIILVDDGSPDNSGAVCDRYAKEDYRIRVIHKPNGGTCDARNKGIEQANGEYLVIIDGDDWLAPDYIEYLLDLIQRPGVNMSMTDSVFTSRDLVQNDGDSIIELTSEEAIAEIIYPWFPIGPWNKMYSMKSLKEAGITFSTKWSGEGLYYSTMAAQAASKVAMGHRRIYYYRLDNENSGLTHYNVDMGINALENIRLIKDSLTIRTPVTLNACDWHIWKNYGYTLFLIIATGQEKKYSELYRDCIKNIRRLMPTVLLGSAMKPKTKVKMLIQSLFPVWWATQSVKKEEEARKQDRAAKKEVC